MIAVLSIDIGINPNLGDIAGALISITLNPLIFKLFAPVQQWLKAHPKLSKQFKVSPEETKTPLD